jgi:hypothetical protein
VLIENLLLFLGGGALGLGLAFACLKLVSAGDYLKVAQMGGTSLDFRVLSLPQSAPVAQRGSWPSPDAASTSLLEPFESIPGR